MWDNSDTNMWDSNIDIWHKHLDGLEQEEKIKSLKAKRGAIVQERREFIESFGYPKIYTPELYRITLIIFIIERMLFKGQYSRKLQRPRTKRKKRLF